MGKDTGVQLSNLQEIIQNIANFKLTIKSPAIKSLMLLELPPVWQKISDDMERFVELGREFHRQFQETFIEGMDALSDPANYRKDSTKVPDKVHRVALASVNDITLDMEKQSFGYLKELIETGIKAHKNRNYHLSIFAIFSNVDGILTTHYKTQNPCGSYPNFEAKMCSFMDSYNNWVPSSKFKKKLKIFFKHRNEIMHGGRHAHFDRNISTISLLFLVLVYYSLKKERR